MRSTSLDPERRTRGVRRGRGVENTEAIRVVVIDHDGLFRTGVVQFLENEGIAVVGQAASGEDGIRAVASCCPDGWRWPSRCRECPASRRREG